MTSGNRTPEDVRLAIQRMASQKDADGHWLLSYEEISVRLKVDRRVVSEEIREAARQWWQIARWKPDPELP